MKTTRLMTQDEKWQAVREQAEKLGPKPAGATPRFSADCFETIGHVETYTVVLSAPAYPKTFDSMTEASEFATRLGRRVSVGTAPVKVRTAW